MVFGGRADIPRQDHEARIGGTAQDSTGLCTSSADLLAKVRGEDHGRPTVFSRYTDHQIWSEVKAAGWKSVDTTHIPKQKKFRAWVPNHD